MYSGKFVFLCEKFQLKVNLIVEQGNTYTKVAIFRQERLEASFKYKQLSISILAGLFEEYELTNGILSSVIGVNPEIAAYLEKKLESFFIFNDKTPLPVRIGYATPSTLGRDRVAAVVGAHFKQPGKNILVIDAGTAITYDVIEASGLYLGGNISPGMTTRFKALHYFTKKLPLVDEIEELPLIGTDTESAIQAGVVNGIVYEMIGYMEDLRLKYTDLLVFLTGGHSFYFERRLKSSIFADINLVLMGLNRILEYNVEN